MKAGQPSQPRPVVIVLAAGQGTRFRASGAGQDKLDAVLAGKPVLGHVLDSVRASGLPWYVVDRARTAHPVFSGMGWSIACGVAATAGAPGWLILPADLPLVRADTLRRVADALTEHEVVLPLHQGERGHPVGFGRACRDPLMALRGDEGARCVLARFPVRRLKVDDPGCVFDIDTWDALLRARELLG